MGFDISLSEDGNILAVSGIDIDYENEEAKWGVLSMRLLMKSGKNWRSIESENQFSYHGIATSLSSDGSVLAIGAPWHGGGDPDQNGYVKIYSHKNGEISQIGEINGESKPLEGNVSGLNSDELGWSLALSGDGSTLVAAAPGNKKVKIYNNDSGSWSQLGEDINLNQNLLCQIIYQ